MKRTASYIALSVTALTLAAVFYMLLASGGWQAIERWLLAGAAALFVAVAWSQAAIFAGRGLAMAANAIIWWTLTAVAYLLVFTVALG